MKINWKLRLRNPWFWLSLGGIILSAMGVSPETLTSWGAVYVAIQDLVHNPFMLFTVGAAVLGVFVDPTTAGIGDSELAMTYTEPKRD